MRHRASYQQSVVLGVVQVHAESWVVRVGLQNMFDWCNSRWHKQRIHWFTFRNKKDDTQTPHNSVTQNSECAQVINMSGILFQLAWKVCQQMCVCVCSWMLPTVYQSCSRTEWTHQAKRSSWPVSSLPAVQQQNSGRANRCANNRLLAQKHLVWEVPVWFCRNVYFWKCSGGGHKWSRSVL